MAHKDKAERAAYNKTYREANKEKRAAYDKAYREANKEKLAAYDKAYQKANKEEVSTHKKAYYYANHGRMRAISKAYYYANKEKRKAYHEANKEKIAAYYAKRRALKLKQIPIHLRDCPHEKQRLVQTYKLRNLLSEATGVKHHVDHMWPLADGGPHWSGNLQVIPAEENLSKSASVCEETKNTIIKSLYTFESERAI